MLEVKHAYKPRCKKMNNLMCRGKGALTEDDGVGEGIAGHEVGLGRAGHSAEHLALAHRVLACRQLDHLGRCKRPTQHLSISLSHLRLLKTEVITITLM